MSGHLYPVVPILQELKRRGHAVAVRAASASVTDLRVLGMDAHALSSAVEAIDNDDWQARSLGGSQRRAMLAFGRRAPLDAVDLQAAIADEQPDTLLVDIMALIGDVAFR